MLIDFLLRTEAKCQRYVESFSALSHFHLRLALLCTILGFVTGGDTLVSVVVGFDKMAENTTWQFFQQQVASPLTARSGADSFHHTAKMVYRLFPPLLGKLCWGCSLKELIFFMNALGYLSGFFFFLYFSRMVSRLSDRPSAFLLTLGVCFIFLGKTFFWFASDGLALLGLLLAMSARRVEVVFLALLAAFWTDERAIIASALVFVWHGLSPRMKAESSSDRPISVRELFSFNQYQIAVVLCLAVHFAMRFSLASIYAIPSTTNSAQALGEARAVLFGQRKIELIPMVTFSAFEGWWLILILSAYAVGRRVSGTVYVLYALCFAGSMLVSYMVFDMTRSMMYTFPAVLIAFRWVYSIVPPTETRRLLIVILLFNVLYPTYYMTHYVWPFFIRILKYSLTDS